MHLPPDGRTGRRRGPRRAPAFLLALTAAAAAFALAPVRGRAQATNEVPPAVVASNVVDRSLVATNSRDAVYDDIATFTEALLLVKRQYVEEKEFRELIYGAINGMLTSLDPHSGFLPPQQFQELKDDTSGHFSGIGIHVGIKDGRVVVLAPIDGSPALRAGLMSGDKLVKIDHQYALGISMDETVRRLRGPKGSKVVVTVEREGRDPFDVTIERDDVKVLSVKGARILRQDVGYIRLTQFGETTGDEFDKALRDLEGRKMTALVVDLRDNPGGLLSAAVEITGMLLPSGADVVSVRGRDGVRDTERYKADGTRHLTDLPVAVLVNGHSASAAEIMAGALQDHHRAVIVGETTFGKASVQNVLRLATRPDAGLRLTTAHYYTPAARLIHGKGIDPDIALAIPPTQWRRIVLRRTYEEAPDVYPPAVREKVEDAADTQLDRAVDIVIGARILETNAK